MRLTTQDGLITGFINSSDAIEGTIEAPEGFAPDMMHTYVVQNGQAVQDPQALLELTKIQKTNQIRAHFEQIMMGVRATVAEYEVQTWDTQREELVRYLRDPQEPTPYVDALAAARGETRDTLFPKIQGKVQQLAAIQGTQQALEKRVEAAATMSELENIVW